MAPGRDALFARHCGLRRSSSCRATYQRTSDCAPFPPIAPPAHYRQLQQANCRVRFPRTIPLPEASQECVRPEIGSHLSAAPSIPPTARMWPSLCAGDSPRMPGAPRQARHRGSGAPPDQTRNAGPHPLQKYRPRQAERRRQGSETVSLVFVPSTAVPVPETAADRDVPAAIRPPSSPGEAHPARSQNL